jgi:hypothetical protein
MADALVLPYNGQPATGGTTIVAAPGGTNYVVVRYIHVVNVSALPAWFTIGIGGTTAATALYYQKVLQPGDYIDWTGNLPIIGTNTLNSAVQTASSITITVGGVSGP